MKKKTNNPNTKMTKLIKAKITNKSATKRISHIISSSTTNTNPNISPWISQPPSAGSKEKIATSKPHPKPAPLSRKTYRKFCKVFHIQLANTSPKNTKRKNKS